MDTKGLNANGLTPCQTLPPLLEALFDVCQLKQVYRRGWLQRGVPASRCESVADHTFGVALTAMLLAEQTDPALDRLRVLQLALVHDLGEVHAGDITPADGVSDETKERLERQGVRRIFDRLKLGRDYLELWEEYVRQESPEACFVRQVEKLEMAVQAAAFELSGMGDMSDFFDSAATALRDPQLCAAYRGLLEARAQGSQTPEERQAPTDDSNS